MIKAYLIREYFATHTLGIFTAIDGAGNCIFQCQVLELPWNDNQRQISCIPEGEYPVKERRTDKFGRHYHIQDVPNRDAILQHGGNYTFQIRGCQLPGAKFMYLNTDAIPDIQSSRKTLDNMLKVLGKEYVLKIGSFDPPTHPHNIHPGQFWLDRNEQIFPTLTRS